MFDRIKFTLGKKSVYIAVDPFFTEDYVLFHEVGDDIHLLERDLKGFHESSDISIYDVSKNLRYMVAPSDEGFSVTVEELDLDALLALGLSRDALDQIILLKKRVLNPRI